jgi:hypothetical protein
MESGDGMSGESERRDYLAYMLRLWCAGPGEGASWRASLQDAHGGRQMGFACLDDAVAYLKRNMGEGKAGLGDRASGECARQGLD